jgi:hypothetical protein
MIDQAKASQLAREAFDLGRRSSGVRSSARELGRDARYFLSEQLLRMKKLEMHGHVGGGV